MLFHFTGIFTVNANITGKPKEYWLKQVEGFNNKAQMGGFHKNLKVLEGYIKANPAKSGFVAGEKLTVGDLMAFCFLSFWYKVWDQEMFVKEFPFLEEYIQKIGAIGPIAEYNQKKRCKHTWVCVLFFVLFSSFCILKKISFSCTDLFRCWAIVNCFVLKMVIKELSQACRRSFWK